MDRLDFWMQQGNRANEVQTATHVDGQIGLQLVSSNASLDCLVNHHHIGAGRFITLRRLYGGVSGQLPTSLQVGSDANYRNVQLGKPF